MHQSSLLRHFGGLFAAVLIETVAFGACVTPVTITTQPASLTAVENTTAIFSVVASGNPAPVCQWYRNNTLIPLATGSSYTTPLVTLADNGDQYCVDCVNACGNVKSTVATLSVIPDTAPPTICSATLSCDGLKITLMYCELVEPTSATDIFIYLVNGGAAIVNSAVLLAGGNTVCLFLDPSTPLSLSAVNTVTVNGIFDLANNQSGLLTATLVPVDTVAPIVGCPGSLTVQCAGSAGTPVPYVATISDNLDPSPVLSCVPASPGPFLMGTTPVTCTGMDSCGNTASCSFNVTVVDTVPPVLNCNLPLTVLQHQPAMFHTVPLTFTATDACSSPVVTKVTVYSDEPLVPLVPDATYTAGVLTVRKQRQAAANGRVYLIVVTATDAAGNSTFCCQAVGVRKNNSLGALGSILGQMAAATASCTATGSALTPHVILP